MKRLRVAALKIVGRLYSWLGEGVEGPCEYEFRCRDYHDKCQATVDRLRKIQRPEEEPNYGKILHCKCCGVPLVIREKGYGVVKLKDTKKGETS